MRSIKIIFEENGDYLIEYLRQRINELGNRPLKGSNEFETIWNVADNDGRKRAMLDIINDIEKISTTKYEREQRGN